jgi:hypothetical protein
MQRMAKDLSIRHDCILADQKDVNLYRGLIFELFEDVLGFDHAAEKLVRLMNDCSQTELGIAMRNEVYQHTKALGIKRDEQIDLMRT